MMRIAFRADSSRNIGHGHVMRCLALANALRLDGHLCTFITRNFSGSLVELIKMNGHCIQLLSGTQEFDQIGQIWPDEMQQTDGEEVITGLPDYRFDWLIVDHYGLDKTWHHLIGQRVVRLAVIDDLANRTHLCDLLIDHNAGRQSIDYRNLVSPHCNVLAGPKYAMLRSEFKYSNYDHRRAVDPAKPRLFISFGGVDSINATCATLECLLNLGLPITTQITVAMGASAMWKDEVGQLVSLLPYSCKVIQNPENMAMLMNEADIGIGAVGVSALERCAMALPSVGVVVSENQAPGASALHQVKAMIKIQLSQLQLELPQAIEQLLNPECHSEMAQRAKHLCDGLGIQRIVSELNSPRVIHA
jgi:UDP-2,4-diacetamido-2,4,6-trideoxy-beta-L-altropyranose hydrolase